jgi:predicted metal-binding membrane protein
LSGYRDEGYRFDPEVGVVMTTNLAPTPARTGRLAQDRLLVAILLAVATVCWWLTLQSAMVMTMAAALPGFLLAWLAMMAAMMLPAVLPAVRLYARASARTAAPTPFFVAGYLLVWTSLGVPAYVAWRVVSPAVMDGEVWAGRFAGAALLVAAAHQLSPLKDACLSQCRTPLGMFLRARGNLRNPLTAVRLGAGHAAYCVGCCWAFMLVLVAVGVMEPLWMVGVAALIFVEKALPFGERVVQPAALLLAAGGLLLLVTPHLLSTLTIA